MDFIKKRIATTIRKQLNLDHYRIFVFGSRAGKEKINPRSDYDIGIEASKKLSLFSLNQIRTELEALPILQKIDLVDFSRVSREFKQVALQKVEILYEQ